MYPLATGSDVSGSYAPIGSRDTADHIGGNAMSHLWVKENDSDWAVFPLDTDLVRLAPEGPAPLMGRKRLSCLCDPLLMRTQDSCGQERCVLLSPPRHGARVNGQRVLVGVCVLSDRDVIALGSGQTVWFSSERRAEVVPFTGEHASCIRCKLPLEPGTPAVLCPAPGCGFWHHQSEDKPCWSYTDGCAACGYPTDLNAGFQWSPADL